MSTVFITKLANDAGFDLEMGEQGGWLQFGVSGTHLLAWIRSSMTELVVGFSRHDIIAEIGIGAPFGAGLPHGAADGRRVANADQLVTILARARVLDRTLPQALLHRYQAAIVEVESTEAFALVRMRRGQEIFRNGLLEYWQGQCAMSGLAVPELLRASHAKPWKDSTDGERLDVHNGLLLAAHLDAAFDQGLITIVADGSVLVSPRLNEDARRILGLGRLDVVRGLREAHQPYLEWHRSRVFQRAL
jgi:hypothetical protein